jgi:hypothetical protein
MTMMRWHRQPQLGDCGLSVGQQSLPERGVGPRAGHDPGAVLGYPMLLRSVLEVSNCLTGLKAGLFEHRFNGSDTLGNRRVLVLLGVCGHDYFEPHMSSLK